MLASESVKIPWFDFVFADIGDEQSLSQSLSTFSGHLKQISVSQMKFPLKFLGLFTSLTCCGQVDFSLLTLLLDDEHLKLFIIKKLSRL